MIFAILLAVLLAGCATTGAPPAADPGISVTGTGRVSLAPDIVTVDIGAEARAPQLADATAEVDRRMRDVLARVKTPGVDVRTIGYNIEPIAESRQPSPGDTGSRIVGYRATNIVQIKTRDVAGVGRLVDAAVAAGANLVRSLRFGLNTPERAEGEARRLAVHDAAARAQQLAAASGVKLGRLLSVTESSSPIRPVGVAMAAVPVEAGQLDVTVVVQARYAIDP
ncbi:MAG: SIMPL domain-containing protein [Candidatus Rokuibacteriota bacterium]